MMQMEKLLNRHCDMEMELMKMAMLKHEETFRQQVHELHRLYRVQKQLMSGGLSGRGPSCRRQQRRALGLHLPAEGHATPQSREDELELTLAVGGRRKRRGEEGTAPAVAFRPQKRDGGEAAAPAGAMARVQCLTQP